MTRNRAFSLMELLVVIGIITLLLSILLPALSGARSASHRAKSASQLRNIQAGMVQFAERNNGWFPGVGTTGGTVDEAGALTADPYNAAADPRVTYWLMLQEALFPSGELVAPHDTMKEAYKDGSGAFANFTISSYSYATLAINDGRTDPRRRSWRANQNSQLVVLSDRNVTSDVDPEEDDPQNPISINDPHGFHIAWNDGHVTLEQTTASGGNTPLLLPVRFSENNRDPADNLFDSSDGDTLMWTEP